MKPCRSAQVDLKLRCQRLQSIYFMISFSCERLAFRRPPASSCVGGLRAGSSPWGTNSTRDRQVQLTDFARLKEHLAQQQGGWASAAD